jgi:hypothetical protein
MKSLKIVFLAGVFILSLCQGADSAARYETLYHLVKTGRIVKVWIGQFLNSTGNKEIKPGDFADALEDALRERKSANFVLVANPADADIWISGDIEKYIYQDVDPIDMALGWGGLAMDAVVKENYVGLEIAYTVKDPKTGRAIWSKTLRPSITKADMPEEGCLQLILAEGAREFVSRCFRRPRK